MQVVVVVQVAQQVHPPGVIIIADRQKLHLPYWKTSTYQYPPFMKINQCRKAAMTDMKMIAKRSQCIFMQHVALRSVHKSTERRT